MVSVVLHTWTIWVISYSGGDDGIRFSRELRARSSSVANIHRMFALYRFPFEPIFPDSWVILTLVEMMGFEPMTPCLQGRCSPSWATPPFYWVFASSPFFRIRERFYPFPVLCQHWTIFPCSFPQSIVATAELNFCVRNGNRWTLCVCNTDLSRMKPNFMRFLVSFSRIFFALIACHIVYDFTIITRLYDKTITTNCSHPETESLGAVQFLLGNAILNIASRWRAEMCLKFPFQDALSPISFGFKNLDPWKLNNISFARTFVLLWPSSIV